MEVLKFLIIWSYAVAGVSNEDNVNETCSPNADDFEVKKQFKVGLVKKKKALTKKKCTPAQKEAGRTKGIQRQRHLCSRQKKETMKWQKLKRSRESSGE